MGKMSRDKGKRGELEVAALLRDFGFRAERGQQHSGTPDSPDVKHDIEGLHIEVKRIEALQLYPALSQAREDCGDDTPVVFHRRNGKQWVAIMDATDFLDLTMEHRQLRAWARKQGLMR